MASRWFKLSGRRGGRVAFGHLIARLPRTTVHHVGDTAEKGRQGEERQLGHPGNHAEQRQRDGYDPQDSRLGQNLTDDLLAQVGIGCRPRHDDAGGRGDYEGGNLAHQSVADSQQGEGPQRLVGRNSELQHPNDKAVGDIDDDDDDSGDGVALHKLAGALHGAVEVRLRLNLLAPALRLFVIDDARVEVGIDGDLFSRHSVEGEPRRNLGDASRAVGDHYELDNHQDQENHHAHDVVPADHEIAEGSDDLARLRVEQNETRRKNVESQPEERCQ